MFVGRVKCQHHITQEMKGTWLHCRVKVCLFFSPWLFVEFIDFFMIFDSESSKPLGGGSPSLIHNPKSILFASAQMKKKQN